MNATAVVCSSASQQNKMNSNAAWFCKRCKEPHSSPKEPGTECAGCVEITKAEEEWRNTAWESEKASFSLELPTWAVPGAKALNKPLDKQRVLHDKCYNLVFGQLTKKVCEEGQIKPQTTDADMEPRPRFNRDAREKYQRDRLRAQYKRKSKR